jgi:hypothetical protein
MPQYPLMYIDPTGEAIQLSANLAEQKEELYAICSAAGVNNSSRCDYYIYANKGRDGKYYVGIYTNGADGKGTSFQNLNGIAGEIGAVINDPRVVLLDIFAAGTTVTDKAGSSRTISPVGGKGAPGATYIGEDRNWHITLLDPSTSPGVLPKDYMYPSEEPGQIDEGMLIANELGHLRAYWGIDKWHWLDPVSDEHGNSEARRLENQVRRLRDPKASIRNVHGRE